MTIHVTIRNSILLCTLLLSGCIDWVDLGGGSHATSARPAEVDIRPVKVCIVDSAGVVHRAEFTKRRSPDDGWRMWRYEVNGVTYEQWIPAGDPAIVECAR